jgi:Skp family chaperone for outer membrane proteins
MKKLPIIFVIFLFFVFRVDCRVVVVVDLKRVASESKAGMGIEKQIEKYNDESGKDLGEMESQIKLLDAKKEKSAEDSRKIEELQVLLYDMVRSKKYQIAEACNRSFAVLDRKMKEVIRPICEERGIEIVVNSEAVVFMCDKCYDITDEVIEKLNEKCPKVEVVLMEQK